MVPHNKKDYPNKEIFIEIYTNNTVKETGKYFNCSEDTIRKWAKHFSIVKISNKFSPNVDEFIKIFNSNTLKDTAKYFKVNVRYIKDFARTIGIYKNVYIKEIPDKATLTYTQTKKRQNILT